VTQLEDPIGLLTGAASRISALARSGDLSMSVPSLGRWKVADVVAHLGGVHRWAARIVATSSMKGPSFTKSKLRGLELCDWFDQGAVLLADTLGAADPAGSCPNFNPGTRPTTTFWIRRQAHETLVHCYDIERTFGSVVPIPTDAATDGTDEYLDVFVRTRGKQTLTAPLRLTTTDSATSWTIAPAAKPGRVNTDAHDSEPVAEIAGPAMALLLLMWNRIGTDDEQIEITGDKEVAASFR